MPGSLEHEATDVEMLLEYEIDYFKYDNCYPRLDGSTQCFGFGKYHERPKDNLNTCDDGCGEYIDLVDSLRHFPSIWQSPSEESR